MLTVGHGSVFPRLIEACSPFALTIPRSLSLVSLAAIGPMLQVDLCVQINVPILGPSPGTFTALSRKSGGRAVLADAGRK